MLWFLRYGQTNVLDPVLRPCSGFSLLDCILQWQPDRTGTLQQNLGDVFVEVVMLLPQEVVLITFF